MNPRDGTERQDDRVWLVTGATSGHGRAVARALASKGADVVLLGRNPAKCAEVQSEIADACGGKAPDILLCDLASRAEVDRAAREVLASGRPLHGLVNNAGLVNLQRQETVDGAEMVFAVNYLAMFQLTLRLLPRLVESAPARIVNVASDMHKMSGPDLDDLDLERGYGWARSYARSKRAILYFTRELARRLEGTGVTVNAVDPGPVASGIGSNNSGFLYGLVSPLLHAFFPSADRAARTAVHLCVSPELASHTGEYWRFMKAKPPTVPQEAEIGPALWAESARRTGVDHPALV
jgi:NAD(P)-dependent dehydrogenase (short-subunit alcohol dehydrogenase family)